MLVHRHPDHVGSMCREHLARSEVGRVLHDHGLTRVHERAGHQLKSLL